MFWVYILTCYDKNKKKTYYTGLTNNLKKRYKAHDRKWKRGAKYTKDKDVYLSYVEPAKDLSHARKRELEIKNYSHEQKYQLVKEKGREIII